MLHRTLRHALLAGIVGGLGLLAGQQAIAETPDTLRFGVISTESSQNQAPLWAPFLEDMSSALGVEVEPFFATDYAAVIQAMRFGKIDLAWYGNKSAMEAVDRAGGEVFAQTVSANGELGYWGLLIAHRDSDLESVEDMLARAGELTFGNGDPNSTSGYLVPGYYVFAQNGVEPSEIFRRTLNANHETNALSVANGHVDVATFFSEGMERLKIAQPDKAEQLKVIWQSPLIPSDPLVWREELPETLKAELRDFIYSYGETDEQRETLEALQWARFVPSDNDQLLPVRQLELFQERARTADDTSLDVAERERRLAELDARLAELDERMQAREAAREAQELVTAAAQ